MNRIKLARILLQNMGWNYFIFRLWYQLKRSTGLLKQSFPTNPKHLDYPSLESWRKSSTKFFNLDNIAPDQEKADKLKTKVDRIKNGEIPFFDNLWMDLGANYHWVTNPQSGFKYHKNQHWTKVSDFSSEQGDIKFVWEKSRFLYLYPVLRYDSYSGEDQGLWVMSEIISWIDANPINCGPNYKCNQEIALRVMNWLYALYYYKNHPVLTSDVFQKIMHHLYWQMHHVYENIDFSRKAVRNNHTLTETLGLCLVGTLLPKLPGAERWARNGREWFEEALSYQVFEDGSYLQYSMNYHRVVVQLLTWAILLGKLNKIPWSPIVNEKAERSLKFLLAHIQGNGHLPNYGANDAALFFPLSDGDFRDYRPQMNALNFALFGKSIFNPKGSEEALAWLGIHEQSIKLHQPKLGTFQFNAGGYYGFREVNSFAFIRCGSHPYRPSQADNLHLDIWYKGENILRDAGSFQYNTDPELVQFFSGTQSHNTVMLNGMDQMEKGPRFIWLDWSQAISATVNETEEHFIFEGRIHAFKHLNSNIYHHRKVTKNKGVPHWVVEDEIVHPLAFDMSQIWNPAPEFFESFRITATDQSGKIIDPIEKPGWYSNSYGHKQKTIQIHFRQQGNFIKTEINAVTD